MHVRTTYTHIDALNKHKLGNRPSPENYKQFEKLVAGCAMVKYKTSFDLYGRLGQTQYGADILSRDRKVIVQCKCYDPTKHTVGDLIEEGKANYKKACGFFPEMETYILATTLDTDTNVQDGLKKQRAAKMEFWFWSNIEKEIIEEYQKTEKLVCANAPFVEAFTEPLFLHPGQPEICLKNLFVTQKYSEKLPNEFSEPRDNLPARLRQFLDQDQETILLIEGDAGCGKSSLAAWMNYHVAQIDEEICAKDNETARQILDGRPLLTIRLRDLDKATIKNDRIEKAIEEKIGWKKERLAKTFPQAVVFFDGFDELCMIDDILNPHLLFDRLRLWLPQGYKAIITSRLNYIDRRWIDHRCRLIVLEHFDRKKRAEWIEKYTGVCGQLIGEDIKKFILAADADSNIPAAIFNTPLTLYMLAAQSDKINIMEIGDNNWRLYYELFHDVIPDAEHRGGEPGRDYDYRTLIYRLTEEIACTMYQGDRKYHLDSDCIRGIIKSLAESAEKDAAFDEETKNFLRQAYALHSYWKADGETGAVEFYHNNIRDFFLCERIYWAFNDFYKKCRSDDDNKTRIANINDFAQYLTNLFKFGYLEKRVLDFFRDRARWEMNNAINGFPKREMELRLLPDLYQHMLTNGFLYDGLSQPNHAQAIESVQRNTALVYYLIYRAFLKEGEHIQWWKNTKKLNDANVIKYFFVRFIAEIGSRSDFGALNLAGTHLYGVNFRGANLQQVDLEEANLRKVNLEDAELQKANLKDADLREAFLHRTNLQQAYLHHANLQEANLCDADFQNADLQYANLQHANLQHANLKFAFVRGANFQDADLRKAILPDGTKIDDNDKARVFLRSLGARI